MLGEDKPSIAPPPNLICLIKTTYTSPKSSLKPAFLAASWAASKLSFSSRTVFCSAVNYQNF